MRPVKHNNAYFPERMNECKDCSTIVLGYIVPWLLEHHGKQCLNPRCASVLEKFFQFYGGLRNIRNERNCVAYCVNLVVASVRKWHKWSKARAAEALPSTWEFQLSSLESGQPRCIAFPFALAQRAVPTLLYHGTTWSATMTISANLHRQRHKFLL